MTHIKCTPAALLNILRSAICSTPGSFKRQDLQHGIKLEQFCSLLELMESATFKRFNTAIDTVFENSEEMDMSVEPVDDEEGEEEYNPDLLVGKALLSDLVSESAKLKSMGLMNKVSYLVHSFAFSALG